MMEVLRNLFLAVWNIFFNISLTFDNFTFKLWQFYLFIILITLIFKMLVKNINGGGSGKD